MSTSKLCEETSRAAYLQVIFTNTESNSHKNNVRFPSKFLSLTFYDKM